MSRSPATRGAFAAAAATLLAATIVVVSYHVSVDSNQKRSGTTNRDDVHHPSVDVEIDDRNNNNDVPPVSPLNISLLNTTNVLWSHRSGHLCLRSDGSFQALTYEREEGMIYVQEMVASGAGGKMYAYEMVDTDLLHAEHASAASTDESGDSSKWEDTEWIDALVGVRYECTVQDLREELGVVSSPRLMTQSITDASTTTTWDVGGFLVDATLLDGEWVPTSIHSPTHDEGGDDDDDGLSFKIDIESVGPCDIRPVGCDVASESQDIPLVNGNGRPTERQLEVALSGLEGLANQEENSHHDGTKNRILGVLQDFQSGVTGTNWCGYKNPLDKRDGPCPGSSGGGWDVHADRACRRHDHGTKWTRLSWGGTRTECVNDEDLRLATRNVVIQAVYGKYGLSQSWGCFAYGTFNCWKKVRGRWLSYYKYGKYCCGEYVKYGPGRYNNLKRFHPWGYYPVDTGRGEKVCLGDLWTCHHGGGCYAKRPRAEVGSVSKC